MLLFAYGELARELLDLGETMTDLVKEFCRFGSGLKGMLWQLCVFVDQLFVVRDKVFILIVECDILDIRTVVLTNQLSALII